MQQCLGKDKLEQLGKERKALALIKSLIYVKEKYALGVRYKGVRYKR